MKKKIRKLNFILQEGEGFKAEFKENFDAKSLSKEITAFANSEGGKIILGVEETIIGAGDAAIVPAGAEHNVINTSTMEELKLYTIYSPANHPDGTIHPTKADALKAEESGSR